MSSRVASAENGFKKKKMEKKHIFFWKLGVRQKKVYFKKLLICSQPLGIQTAALSPHLGSDASLFLYACVPAGRPLSCRRVLAPQEGETDSTLEKVL